MPKQFDDKTRILSTRLENMIYMLSSVDNMLKLAIVMCLCFSQVFPTPADNVNTFGCEEVGDCIIENDECDNPCGCDSSTLILRYNETLGKCVLDYKEILQSLGQKYNTEEYIRKEVNRVFQGVMISVILFITCVGVGFLSACVYCCRIGYTDNKLKEDVDALKSKLKRDGILKKSMRAPKPSRDPAADSCNIIVEEAGVYVV